MTAGRRHVTWLASPLDPKGDLMKRLALALALLAPLAAAAGESGLVVFHTQCSRCHGEDGRGRAVFNTPDFLSSKVDAAGMEKVIAAGRAKMPAFSAKLTPAEIKDVAAYIKAGLPAK
jgi:mono/diheme cytochrome c family protein